MWDPALQRNGEECVDAAAVTHHQALADAQRAVLLDQGVEVPAGGDRSIRPSRMMRTTRNGVSARTTPPASPPTADIPTMWR
jgi:hypothetical protein